MAVKHYDELWPAKERRHTIIDRGWVGQARNIHVEGGNVNDVLAYIRTLPPDDYVWIVAYGNVYLSSPPLPDQDVIDVDDEGNVTQFEIPKGTKLYNMGKEHRTVLAYAQAREINRGDWTQELRQATFQFYNPRSELHEVDYFSIRHKPPMQAPRPKQPPPGQLTPGTKEYEEHVKRSRRSVPKKYRE